MSLIADTVARLRVCHAAGLPADTTLVAQALTCLEDAANANLLRDNRDALIRRAALLLGAGSTWSRAASLESEASRMLRTWPILRQQPPGEADTVRACLHAAALHAELPTSQRQFFRILDASD